MEEGEKRRLAAKSFENAGKSGGSEVVKKMGWCRRGIRKRLNIR
jgi:hypothetical protein